MERNLGYLTAGRPPALDLDLALFISTWKIFCGRKRHNSKRGSFWQAMWGKIFTKWMKNWGHEEFRLISLIFEIALSSKKYQLISFIDWHFAFLKGFLFFGNHLFSDFIILFVNFGSMLIHLIWWFSSFFIRISRGLKCWIFACNFNKNFWTFVYGNF